MKNYQIDSFIYNSSSSGKSVYISGWYFNDHHMPVQWASFSNGKPIEISQFETVGRSDIVSLFPEKPVPMDSGFRMRIDFKEEENPSLTLMADDVRLVDLSSKELKSSLVDHSIEFNVNIREIHERAFHIQGWVISLPNRMCNIYVVDKNNEKLDVEINRFAENPPQFFVEPSSNKYGFSLLLEKNLMEEELRLVFEEGHNQKSILLKPQMNRFQRISMNWAHFKEQRNSLIKVKGSLRYLMMLARKPVFHFEPGVKYTDWLEENVLKPSVLNQQKKEYFRRMPVFSIVVPAYKPDLEFFRALVDSVINQTYSNWELIIADGSADQSLGEVLESYNLGSKIRYVYTGDQPDHGISANTNAAVKEAKGEYLVFSDHDDLLSVDALYEMAKAINEGEYKLLYSDEDKVTTIKTSGMQKTYDVYDELFFKPDFSLDYLRSCNYINHLTVMKKELFDAAGGLRPEYDGAQDYDLLLRVVSMLKNDQIKHIPRILYHWRKHPDSTAAAMSSKSYAVEAGRKALESYYAQNGIAARVAHSPYPGTYLTEYLFSQEPMISIIIPTKDHKEDLNRTIDSIMEKTTYKNFEILIVENNSELTETFENYKQLQSKYDNVQVLTWEYGFNYSAINNFAARQAKGEYLLLLNNDTKAITPDFLERMVSNAMRPEVGAVGIKLLYEDNSIQHAGVILGPNGPFHAFLKEKEESIQYTNIKNVQHNVIAVTGACLMVSREKYWKAGGLDESFAVAYNDIDFCMKLYQMGYINVILEDVRMYHLESLSRGLDTGGEKYKRFRKEQFKILNRYRDIFEKGDPFYNPNLSLMNRTGSYRLNKEKEEIQKIWEVSISDEDIRKMA